MYHVTCTLTYFKTGARAILYEGNYCTWKNNNFKAPIWKNNTIYIKLTK